MKESAKNAMFGSSIPTSSSSSKRVLDVGGNDGKRSRKHFPDASITVLDLKNGWDVMRMGLPYGDWEIVFMNHVIEHVSDPDLLLDECYKVMSKDSVLEIGTPNLAAWFNRILFLFGYVPHSVELSKRYGLGKAFNWNDEELGGHIYVYTVPAIVKLLKIHGFRNIQVVGEASTYPCNPIIRFLDKVLTKLSPTLASAVRIRCTL